MSPELRSVEKSGRRMRDYRNGGMGMSVELRCMVERENSRRKARKAMAAFKRVSFEREAVVV